MTDAQNIDISDFYIGPHKIEGQAVLAPLTGVTDVFMRRIAKRTGAGLVVSEMIASNDLVHGKEEARLRAEGKGIFPHVIQLAGCSPSLMSEATRLAEASGAKIIDINMGCPAKRVTGGWAGSSLMRDVPLACKLIEAVVKATNLPVTLKMRLGWDDASYNAALLAQHAENIGVQAITIHGRTRQQFYKGRANWTAIQDIVKATSLPVIANGDVVCANSAKDCLQQSKAKAVMIGRAAIGQPWIVGEIAAKLANLPHKMPSPEHKQAMILEHYNGLLSLFGVRIGLRHARKHLKAYAGIARQSGFGISLQDEHHLLTTDNSEEAVKILSHLYIPTSFKDVA